MYDWLLAIAKSANCYEALSTVCVCAAGVGNDAIQRGAVDRQQRYTLVDQRGFEEDGVVDAVELFARTGAFRQVPTGYF